ncbi:MAG: N-acetyltransferase family protein [Gemmatimonadota bacterium]|nr:N-acetyltransferase family protein [Gemmatimonadota bacterium]
MRIRLATESDGTALAAIYAPAVTARVTSFELVAPGGDEMARRLRALHPRHPWLVCEAEGEVIGYAYASPHRERAAYQWSVDVSAYVDASVYRRGVGRALYTSLFALLVAQRFRNAYAGITLPNPASEGMHRALGFVSVGIYREVGYKFGAWHDVVWLERALAPRIIEPPPPLLLTDLSATTLAHAMTLGESAWI